MTMQLITVEPSILVYSDSVRYTVDKGNTVGSLGGIKQTDWAYVAGFLDGDGSVMAQVKHRGDSSRGWRIMFTLCLYQDTRHEEPLRWMRELFGIGYLSRRNDGITELRVNGYREVFRILTAVQPYIRFKQRQVETILEMIHLLHERRLENVSTQDRERLLTLLDTVRTANYAAHRRTFSIDRLRQLLFPMSADSVTTEAERPR